MTRYRTPFIKQLILLFCLLTRACMPLRAQAPNSAWRLVQELPEGTKIRLRSYRGFANCSFISADENSLTCLGPYRVFLGGRATRTFARMDIEWIKRSRRGLSTLAGVAVGAGAGVAIGAGVDASEKGGDDSHLLAGVFGILGGILSYPLASSTDFLAGPFIYRVK